MTVVCWSWLGGPAHLAKGSAGKQLKELGFGEDKRRGGAGQRVKLGHEEKHGRFGKDHSCSGPGKGMNETVVVFQAAKTVY